MKVINKIKIVYIIYILVLSCNILYAEVANNENTITSSNTNEVSTDINTQKMEEKLQEIIDETKIKDTKDINKTNTITIQALNKITGKNYEYKIRIGESKEFERLIITPLYCWASAPTEVVENKALLKVVENKLNKEQEEIFYGWMFSSSPSISTLEHPMYDIKVVDCEYIVYEEETKTTK